ncbi:hypothetical protein NLJ89_g2859 [Agrocybe chaxingu]|uniref:Uncharacterized protein n=1 Tax=Agrocybe chaxingu TaxID=84603 RepID=A0A9W8K6H3_9AGAR|nr:hypothetical protein NLJ89_g2859 [Agrocybe chaxingu]
MTSRIPSSRAPILHPSNTLIMPPLVSLETEPQGTRKCKASQKVLENGDPLIVKKQALQGHPGPASSTTPAPSHSRSARVEDADDPKDHRRSAPPRNPNRVLEAADGSDDDAIIVDKDMTDLPGLEELDDSEDEDEEVEEAEESAEAELERLKKEWNSPIYVFFKSTPAIEYINDRRVHVFECAAKHCCGRNGRHVRRYLDTGDAKSTGNLRKHTKLCWGDEAVAAGDKTRDVHAAREALAGMKDLNGSITSAFERVARSKVTYSNRQHTTTETRAEIVRWVAESKRPFRIVKDRGFQSLMKTGRPDYHIPLPETVSRDVKRVFVRAHDGTLSFATDAWTSPNHKAFIALTIHLEHDGVPISLLLDLVEVAKSHSGVNLAVAFANVLEEFGISDKGCNI